MQKKLLIVMGVLLASLITCLTCVALASNGGRDPAAAENETLVIPTVSDSQDASRDGLQPWNKQKRSKKVSATRNIRSTRESATASNAAENDDAVSQRSPNDDHSIGKIVLPSLAGMMATGGIALVIFGLRRRPIKQRKQKHASMALLVQNAGHGRHRGPLGPIVPFALANDEKPTQDAPNTKKELRKAA